MTTCKATKNQKILEIIDLAEALKILRILSESDESLAAQIQTMKQFMTTLVQQKKQ